MLSSGRSYIVIFSLIEDLQVMLVIYLGLVKITYIISGILIKMVRDI